VLHAGARVAVAALVALSLACGSDSPAGPDNPASPVGDYSLTTFNGKAPPVMVLSDTNYSVLLQSASLSLTADGRYRSIATIIETVLNHPSTYVDTATGTWVQGSSAGSLVFTDAFDGSKTNATWAGRTLTAVQSGDGLTATFVYTRK
jgi:hypothetical protein